MVEHILRLSESKNYIICEILGEISAENIKVIATDLGRFGLEVEVNHYFIDMRQAYNQVGAFQLYTFAYTEIAKVDRPHRPKTVLLVRQDDHSHDFMEVTMRNAGYNVRLFRDEAEAIAWLE